MSFWDNFNTNTGTGNGIDIDELDDWIDRISGYVGMVVEGVGKIVGIVQNAQGKQFYETDTGDYIPVEELAGPEPGTVTFDTNTLLLIGAAILLFARK
tara:strand:+ start:195 stop:488 length:294 start_codon:yes stop_codon:yes gene_type:complete